MPVRHSEDRPIGGNDQPQAYICYSLQPEVCAFTALATFLSVVERSGTANLFEGKQQQKYTIAYWP